jgi:hypothetical protein
VEREITSMDKLIKIISRGEENMAILSGKRACMTGGKNAIKYHN